jgi:hypothetical protein
MVCLQYSEYFLSSKHLRYALVAAKREIEMETAKKDGVISERAVRQM